MKLNDGQAIWKEMWEAVEGQAGGPKIMLQWRIEGAGVRQWAGLVQGFGEEKPL